MKKLILLGIILLLIPLVFAKTNTINLQKGQSFVIENINVSLVEFSNKDDKIVICVNDKKQIIDEDEEKRVNGVLITPRTITASYAELRLEADCDDCKISENKECFSKPPIEKSKPIVKNETKINNKTEVVNETSENKEIKKAEYFSVFRSLVEWVTKFFR